MYVQLMHGRAYFDEAADAEHVGPVFRCSEKTIECSCIRLRDVWVANGSVEGAVEHLPDDDDHRWLLPEGVLLGCGTDLAYYDGVIYAHITVYDDVFSDAPETFDPILAKLPEKLERENYERKQALNIAMLTLNRHKDELRVSELIRSLESSKKQVEQALAEYKTKWSREYEEPVGRQDGVAAV